MPEWLSGPALGGALVGLVWAIARAIQRRSEASAAQDEASAKAVVALLAQLTDLRRDVERLTTRCERLQGQLDGVEDALGAATSRCAHLEGQVHVLTMEAGAERARAQQAETRAEALAVELRDLRLAIAGGHTTITLPPARG